MHKVKAVTGVLALIGAIAPGTMVVAQPIGKPSWLKPGMRLTYYAAAAAVPGSFRALVPDPDGNYRDPASGQMLSEKAVPGASGHGFTEVTVASVDDRTAVLDIRPLGMNLANANSLSLLTYSAHIGKPDDAEFWRHPARLAELRSNVTAGIGVYRMRYSMNGRTYKAVRITRSRPRRCTTPRAASCSSAARSRREARSGSSILAGLPRVPESDRRSSPISAFSKPVRRPFRGPALHCPSGSPRRAQSTSTGG